jgi:hypothetical protein
MTCFMLHSGINKVSDIDKLYLKDKESIATLTSTVKIPVDKLKKNELSKKLAKLATLDSKTESPKQKNSSQIGG